MGWDRAWFNERNLSLTSKYLHGMIIIFRINATNDFFVDKLTNSSYKNKLEKRVNKNVYFSLMTS